MDAIGQLFTRIGTPGHDNPAINDKEYKKGKGGIAFTGDGQGQEGRKVEFPDNKPVDINKLMTLMGMYGGSGGFANFS